MNRAFVQPDRQRCLAANLGEAATFSAGFPQPTSRYTSVCTIIPQNQNPVCSILIMLEKLWGHEVSFLRGAPHRPSPGGLFASLYKVLVAPLVDQNSPTHRPMLRRTVIRVHRRID